MSKKLNYNVLEGLNITPDAPSERISKEVSLGGSRPVTEMESYDEGEGADMYGADALEVDGEMEEEGYDHYDGGGDDYYD